jgi:hypothetical protein
MHDDQRGVCGVYDVFFEAVSFGLLRGAVVLNLRAFPSSFGLGISSRVLDAFVCLCRACEWVLLDPARFLLG